ncbi:MAG: trypsin-like peptidase domain-containing protein [Planctomycetota bacterium]
MSDGFPDPHSDPQYPPQSIPPYGPDLRNEPHRGGVRLGWAFGLLLFLLLLWIVPTFVEQIQYAATRGKQRAESEVARQLLDEGKGATIAQYRYVVKAVQSSVVGVKASRSVDGQDTDELSSFLFGQGRGLREQDQGSGVIVDVEGYIITNYHVVSRASEVNVELSDGSKPLRAQIVGIDPATDLAVLKISGANLTAAPWGKSSDLEVGDPVLAIGNPFGLARTVTAGILSATGRHAVVEHVNYQDFLQTDAAVNPGNSGGPLVNMKGQVVGINTAIVGPTYQGISFAIPSDMVHQVYEQLIKSGKVARGWLGVSMKELTAEESERLGVHGALVTGILPNAPAAEAGIQRGDVITKWNHKNVSGPAELGLQVAWSKIGEKATATVHRDGETLEFTVTVGQRPERLR